MWVFSSMWKSSVTWAALFPMAAIPYSDTITLFKFSFYWAQIHCTIQGSSHPLPHGHPSTLWRKLVVWPGSSPAWAELTRPPRWAFRTTQQPVCSFSSGFSFFARLYSSEWPLHKWAYKTEGCNQHTHKSIHIHTTLKRCFPADFFYISENRNYVPRKLASGGNNLAVSWQISVL